MNKVKLIALMGKAGSGKDTILKHLSSYYPDKYHEVISCTTRPPREGEQNGVNYYFLNIDDFTQKILNGDMLEVTEFNNWHYGTSLSSLSTDKINIGVFNPEGIRCLIEDSLIDLSVYYVQADDKERLLRQLNREKHPNVEEIIRRFSADQKDFNFLDDIKYSVLENNNLGDLSSAVDVINGAN